MIRSLLVAAGLTLAAAPALASDQEDALVGLELGTWIDPLGCEHHYLRGPDSEGYLSEKLTVDGASVCGGVPSQVDWDTEVWVDPDGCAHWHINDGQQGYLSRVRFADGRPSCGQAASALAERFDAARMRGTIWTDPDGCTHFVADDGFEGFMSARLTPDGRPVCLSQ